MESTEKENNPLVRPVYRKAILAGINPKTNKLSARNHARSFREILINDFNNYIELLSNISGYDKKELTYDKSHAVQVMKEGGTFVVNAPLIHGKRKNSINFETRLSTAFCSEGRKAKVWARISLYNNKDTYLDSYERIRLNNNIVLKLFENIVDKSSEWSFYELKKCINGKRKSTIIENDGCFDIRVLSSEEKALNNILNKPEGEVKDYTKLLKFKEIRELLEKYYKKITPNFNGTLNNIIRDEPKKGFLMHSPLYLEDNEGRIRSRDVLFLNIPDKSTIRTSGVGYDNSLAGNLGLLSSLDMVRFWGKKA